MCFNKSLFYDCYILTGKKYSKVHGILSTCSPFSRGERWISNANAKESQGYSGVRKYCESRQSVLSTDYGEGTIF